MKILGKLIVKCLNEKLWEISWNLFQQRQCLPNLCAVLTETEWKRHTCFIPGVNCAFDHSWVF